MNFDRPFVDVRVCWQPPGLRSSHAFGHRLPAILLLALMSWALAGCGSSGHRGGAGYADRPPSDRVAYTAWQEWTRFGRSTVVYGGQAGGYINRSGVSERSEPLASKIGDYWGSCGHPDWNGRTSSKPWSGAFVAWVMSRSGIPAGEFPRDGRHGGYLAALYDHAAARRSRRLPAACAQRICAQAGRPRLHRHAPGRPGGTPIRAPRGGASTAPPTIATSSPTCAAATCRRSAAT